MFTNRLAPRTEVYYQWHYNADTSRQLIGMEIKKGL